MLVEMQKLMQSWRHHSFQRRTDTLFRSMYLNCLDMLSVKKATAATRKGEIYHTSRKLSSNVLHKGHSGYKHKRWYRHKCCPVSRCAFDCPNDCD